MNLAWLGVVAGIAAPITAPPLHDGALPAPPPALAQGVAICLQAVKEARAVEALPIDLLDGAKPTAIAVYPLGKTGPLAPWWRIGGRGSATGLIDRPTSCDVVVKEPRLGALAALSIAAGDILTAAGATDATPEEMGWAQRTYTMGTPSASFTIEAMALAAAPSDYASGDVALLTQLNAPPEAGFAAGEGFFVVRVARPAVQSSPVG